VIESQLSTEKVTPLCPVFGTCGGCLYQDVTYEAELEAKQALLRNLLGRCPGLDTALIQPVVASPDIYHSRSRLDLTFLRIKSGEMFMGFMPPQQKRVLSIDSCAIAREAISDFIPELKRQAAEKLPPDYRIANIVVKTGDDGRVFWGGIGRHSLRMRPDDYLWTEVRGKRIHFSLETFFQANLSILPALMDKIESLVPQERRGLFLDLYSGVGLFGIAMQDFFKRIVMLEEHAASVEIARYNIRHHHLPHAEAHEGRVEDKLAEVLAAQPDAKSVAMIDPPRKGLSASALDMLIRFRQIDFLFYLSCHPESLARDLTALTAAGWNVRNIVPFDFFPRTRHLETLVLLERPEAR
jgi:23S rRNA (uracil1939-C5)-methyltransferase/tRNA (uracil-5-)-methyltransferase